MPIPFPSIRNLYSACDGHLRSKPQLKRLLEQNVTVVGWTTRPVRMSTGAVDRDGRIGPDLHDGKTDFNWHPSFVRSGCYPSAHRYPALTTANS